jgi:hypothetical protein
MATQDPVRNMKVSPPKLLFWLKCTLNFVKSRQPLEISVNDAALRAHHSPTFNIEIVSVFSESY